MIPAAYIQAWSATAPWPDPRQIEQDLIICRALCDLHHGLGQLSLDTGKLIACFEHYLALEGSSITRAVAEQRMLEKLTRDLTEDIAPLLPAGVRFDSQDASRAFEHIWQELIVSLKGDGWKLTEQAIERLRLTGHPDLLKS